MADVSSRWPLISVGREGGGAWMEPAPEQQEVEGRGGAFWYEVPH